MPAHNSTYPSSTQASDMTHELRCHFLPKHTRLLPFLYTFTRTLPHRHSMPSASSEPYTLDTMFSFFSFVSAPVSLHRKLLSSIAIQPSTVRIVGLLRYNNRCHAFPIFYPMISQTDNGIRPKYRHPHTQTVLRKPCRRFAIGGTTSTSSPCRMSPPGAARSPFCLHSSSKASPMFTQVSQEVLLQSLENHAH